MLWPEDERPVFRNRQVRVQIQERGEIKPYGGLSLAHDLAMRLGIDRDINESVPLRRRHLPCFESDHLLTLAENRELLRTLNRSGNAASADGAAAALKEVLPMVRRHFGKVYVRGDKWIKQHLRIKAFYGTSENAVKTQIWIAICTYLLVAIARKRLDVKASLYTILQILSVTLFEKTPIFRGLFRCRVANRGGAES